MKEGIEKEEKELNDLKKTLKEKETYFKKIKVENE